MPRQVARYRYEVLKTIEGWRYRILEGDREVLTSGGFFLRTDAVRTGQHFASDNDLEVNLRR